MPAAKSVVPSSHVPVSVAFVQERKKCTVLFLYVCVQAGLHSLAANQRCLLRAILYSWKTKKNPNDTLILVTNTQAKDPFANF